MKISEKQNGWVAEFKEFLHAEPCEVPRHVSQKIQEDIHQRLNPSLRQIFFRLALVHGVVSVFILSFCPQFGVRIFPGMDGLSAIFMRGGMSVCMLCCGLVFMAGGIGAVVLLFPAEYLRTLRRYHLFPLVIWTFVSCGVLVAIGQVFAFSWVLFWVIGGLLGSFISFELGYRLRFAD